MYAIYENGMSPEAPAPPMRPMTLRQVLEASQTYFGILRAVLRANSDDETRGRMVARMDQVTALLESEVQRQMAGPGDHPTGGMALPPPHASRLARVA